MGSDCISSLSLLIVLLYLNCNGLTTDKLENEEFVDILNEL